MKRRYREEQIKAFLESYIQVKEVSFIGCGCDSDAFFVNESLVFKFPKSQMASKRIEKEISLLKQLQGGFEIEIPSVEMEGNFAVDGKRFVFFASKKLNGQILRKESFLRLTNEQIDAAAQVIARFMQQMHARGYSHGDLSLDHVLFENGAVCGILDFADSKKARYKGDFDYLLDGQDEKEFGKEFGLKVLDYYSRKRK